MAASDEDLESWMDQLVVDRDAEPVECVSLEEAELRALAEKKAEATRRQWERQGRVTRAEYSRLRTAVPAEIQDDIVRLRRAGATRKAIMESFRNHRPTVTEYAVKRVLRVFAYDPEAFDDGLDGILVVRR